MFESHIDILVWLNHGQQINGLEVYLHVKEHFINYYLLKAQKNKIGLYL